MFVFDTNHFRERTHETALGRRLEERMAAADEDFVLAVVTAEEALRGWLARIASAREIGEQVLAYTQLDRVIRAISEYTLLQWDTEAAARFQQFRAQGVRIGTLDLRIACIVLEHDATLLTRDTVDFARVPGLRFENWLD